MSPWMVTSSTTQTILTATGAPRYSAGTNWVAPLRSSRAPPGRKRFPPASARARTSPPWDAPAAGSDRAATTAGRRDSAAASPCRSADRGDSRSNPGSRATTAARQENRAEVPSRRCSSPAGRRQASPHRPHRRPPDRPAEGALPARHAGAARTVGQMLVHRDPARDGQFVVQVRRQPSPIEPAGQHGRTSLSARRSAARPRARRDLTAPTETPSEKAMS